MNVVPAMVDVMGRTRGRSVTDNPSLLARIDRALFRLANAGGLPLQRVGDTSDPEIVLLDCRAKLQQAYAVAAELRAAVLEQVGKDQTDRLRNALNRSITILE